jgi:hypothetical protein
MKTVALILDPNFGQQRLERIAQEMPVWVLSSPSNDPAIEETRRKFKEGVNVTSFMPGRADDRLATCAQVLYDIDEHHGPWSSTHPYEALLVFGAIPADFSQQAMEALELAPTGAVENALVLRKRRDKHPATG